MFWNSEFLDSSPSHIDVLLQMQTVKLSDILFEDDLLQELKTSNISLGNFLNKPEVIAELVDNIIQLTEKDCCDKLLYSRVHAAYISCEILTGGSSEIFAALMNHPESLNKIISCLTIQPRQLINSVTPSGEKDKPVNEDVTNKCEIKKEARETIPISDEEREKEKPPEDDNPSLLIPPRPQTPKPSSITNDSEDQLNETKLQSENDISETLNQTPNVISKTSDNGKDCKLDSTEFTMTKVVPQKATLVSKLISNIHSLAAANLSCHITKDIASFTRLINLLVYNIDISGSFEILSTFIKPTSPPELRYVFCELLSKMDFVYSLIDVMTLSDIEDKQRNACQLLCDIIVIGRQDASEQTDSGPMAQDMLVELLESTKAVHVILNQMFSENMRNSTAIVCGMKVLQTLLEQISTSDVQLLTKTIEQTGEEIEKHLIKFHELLLNPPKQEPIKTTFGIIQKPLGYMRLEVVNLIRALISTNSPNIIRKLVELRTMKVIIDLFIEYSWNNLLHTQVEQALCLIINNYRHDEELNYNSQIEMHQENHKEEKQQQPIAEQSATEIPSRALLSQFLNECDLIGRLLLPSQKQANFGHIIQMINSIAINRDLDTIRDHLNEMKDKRPELYDRWTTFVNVDVASFKEISLYYDAQSASNNVNHRYAHTQHHQNSNSHILTSSQPLNSSSDNVNSSNNNGDDQYLAYFSFTRETVIPAINVDVLPRLRRSKNTH